MSAAWWFVALVWLMFGVAVSELTRRQERRLDAVDAAAVDDETPVEVDCPSCHGLGYNDSLLPGPATDRTCGDCDGTGVAVVWQVDCPRCAGHGTVYVGHDPQTGVPMDEECPMCLGYGVVDAERVS